MKKLIIGAVALAGLLSACSADETDFKETAEKFIKEQLEDAGQEDVETSCDEPADTEVGTKFNCSATSGGVTANYTATITGEKEVTVGAPEGDAAEVETDVEEEVDEAVDEVEDEVEEELDEDDATTYG